MKPFYSLTKKVNYLSSQVSESVLQSLHDKVKTVLAKSSHVQNSHLASFEGLCVDIIYPFLRHRSWLESVLWNEITFEFFTCDLRLTKTLSHELVELLIVEVNTIFSLKENSALKNDVKEFLRYIVVASTTASNELSLMSDLGFGPTLLKRIKKSASLMIQPEHSDTTIYSSENDHLFLEVVKEFSLRMKSKPWILDIERVGFLLLDSGVEKLIKISEEFRESLFHLLLQIGNQSGLSIKQIQYWFHKSDPSFENKILELWTAPQKTQAVEKFMLDLSKSDLIYNTQKIKKGEVAFFWRLTRLGEEITSERFSADHPCLTKNDLEVVLKKANPFYRYKLIVNLPENLLSPATKLLEYQPHLFSPEAVEALLVRLSSTMSKTELFELARTLCQRTLCHWTKNAIFRALSTWTNAETKDIIVQRLNALENTIPDEVEKNIS